MSLGFGPSRLLGGFAFCLAVAAPDQPVARARLGALPLYGGQAALRHALQGSGANAVVVLGGTPKDAPARQVLRAHLDTEGGLDVYCLKTTVERMEVEAGD